MQIFLCEKYPSFQRGKGCPVSPLINLLYHHLAGLRPSAVPGNSMDGGRSESGRKECSGAPLMSEVEFLVRPKMFPLAVTALH